jgi:hypothetical protein
VPELVEGRRRDEDRHREGQHPRRGERLAELPGGAVHGVQPHPARHYQEQQGDEHEGDVEHLQGPHEGLEPLRVHEPEAQLEGPPAPPRLGLRRARPGDEPMRDQLAAEDQPHEVGAHVPAGGSRDSGGDLLKGALAVRVLSDAVEQLRQLGERPVALDQPLAVTEAALQRPAERHAGRESRPFRHRVVRGRRRLGNGQRQQRRRAPLHRSMYRLVSSLHLEHWTSDVGPRGPWRPGPGTPARGAPRGAPRAG